LHFFYVWEGRRTGKLGRFCRGFYVCTTLGKENRREQKFLGQPSDMLGKEIAKKERREEDR